MVGNIFGSDTLIVIIIAMVVLFGGSQLPKLAKNVGAAGHEFRRAQREAEAEHVATEASAPVTAVPVNVVALPTVALATATAPAPSMAASAPAPDDKLVVSRSDLRQELARLMDERDRPTVG